MKTVATLMIAFMQTSQTFHLPPGLLSALCYQESKHKVHAINPNDGGSASFGVCQIKLATAQMLGYEGSEKTLRQANVNVFYAGKYLRKQLDRYAGDPRKAVAAYNAGRHAENARGLTKNRKYVSSVFQYWAQDK